VPPSVPPRSKADPKFTWNAESVFADSHACSEEAARILKDAQALASFQGRLSESAGLLKEALRLNDELSRRASVVAVYAGFSHAVDTTNEEATAMMSRAGDVSAQVGAAAAFIRPEVLSIGWPKLESWLLQDPDLSVYGHFFEDLYRKQAHVRSAEVEHVLGLVSDPLEAAGNSTSMLTNADFTFPAALDSRGRKVEVAQGNIVRLLHSPDRRLRQRAWENYVDRYWEFRHTLATNLASSIKANIFRMRVRGHSSSLEASFFDLNIPVEVFHSLLSAFRRNLPVWHRYFDLRKRVLGLKSLRYYDLWAPLTSANPRIPFARAVELICEGLAPMGAEYVEVVRRGCLRERWVDVYPNRGKSSGAFSWGSPGTHPFICMNYTDQMISLSTLAHELGHSMHSYLSWRSQPQVYTDYSLFVAEVASNFHQALVRDHLLRSVDDTDFQIAVLEEAMSNFLRYFLQMPTLARFELETHERTERGEPLTAEVMSGLMADLFEEALGPQADVDRRRVGMVWSTFGHLFADYYVYAYATGIAAAHALAARVIGGEPNAVEDYQGFLRAGASDYPLNVLRRAGVDLTSPQPVDAAFAVMASYIDQLDKLLGSRRRRPRPH
jgi:oligoendopeptidase F